MHNVYHLGCQKNTVIRLDTNYGIYNLILVAHLCTFMISLCGTGIGYVGN